MTHEAFNNFLERFGANLKVAKTSELIAVMLNPQHLVAEVTLNSRQPTQLELEQLDAALMMVLAELDRRVPIPVTNRVAGETEPQA